MDSAVKSFNLRYPEAFRLLFFVQNNKSIDLILLFPQCPLLSCEFELITGTLHQIHQEFIDLPGGQVMLFRVSLLFD